MNLLLDRIRRGLGVAVMLAFAAVAVTGAASAQTVIKVGIGSSNSEESLSRSIGAFKTYVETKSAGGLVVRLFWGTLGGALQTTEQVRDGTLEIALTDDSVTTGFYKPMMALQIPYLLPSAAAAWEFMREPALWKLADGLRKTSGIRTLAFSENGFRNITNNVRAVRGPEDMAGLKMRTMQSPVYGELMRSLGAAATPIAFPEMHLALRQGVVDGQENSAGAAVDYKLYEVQKYFAVNEHVYGFHMLIINDDFFMGLSEDHKRILIEAAQLHSQTASSWRANQSVEALGKLASEGMDIHITSVAEKQAFKEMVQPAVIAYIVDQIGREPIDEILAAAEAASQRLYAKY